MVTMDDFIDTPHKEGDPEEGSGDYWKPSVKSWTEVGESLPSDNKPKRPADDNPPPENPGDKPTDGKILYEYADFDKKEPELIKIEDKEKEEKKENKRRRINMEMSRQSEKNKSRDPNEKDAVDKVFHGIFDIFDSLFGFFGLGKEEKREEGKKGKRKEENEMER